MCGLNGPSGPLGCCRLSIGHSAAMGMAYVWPSRPKRTRQAAVGLTWTSVQALEMAYICLQCSPCKPSSSETVAALV
jgi:hypothetical protein